MRPGRLLLSPYCVGSTTKTSSKKIFPSAPPKSKTLLVGGKKVMAWPDRAAGEEETLCEDEDVCGEEDASSFVHNGAVEDDENIDAPTLSRVVKAA
ncbi:unnamed protein product [Peronospora belbahrii]|uniref:Uncharacterized protein n=1 Tax=Peronospora belbahrii TaxID=622444 RepID=A0AAU9KYI2_9STRA|nr:unnamed protein product [Peronospora belbahrii]CAH0521167.1 unnamed protein product [Peronospora belbahrii]